jgi:hypothetical protein
MFAAMAFAFPLPALPKPGGQQQAETKQGKQAPGHADDFQYDFALALHCENLR